MTAILRQKPSLRGRGNRLLTVYPNDGRHPEEFTVRESELRRIAWQILADLCPDEAKAAAAESGVRLATVTRPPPIVRSRMHAVMEREVRAYERGSPHHLLLAVLSRAPNSPLEHPNTVLPRRPGGYRWILRDLRHRGFAGRTNIGGAGSIALFRLTEEGEAELQRLERKAAA